MSRPQHGGNLAWAAAIAGCPASYLTDFSASINPHGLPQSAIAALVNSTPELTSYPDPEYSQLRSALAVHHNISSDYIMPGNGSAELLTWAARELAQQKVTYLVTPAFGDYKRALTAFGANIQTCSLSLSSTRAQTLRPYISFPLPISLSPPPQSGLIINNPHNPTGQLWTKESILPYVEKYDLVVLDEAFMDFLPPAEEQSLIPLINKFPNLVILRSLTKFYSLPGLRIGYAIAHPERLQRWQKWRDPWSVNTLAAAAAIAVLQDREFQEQTWNWLPSTRRHLVESLAKISGLQLTEGVANFLLVKTEISATDLQRELLQNYRILIRDCFSFPELGDRYFRVAVRLAKDNANLVEAIATIFDKHPRSSRI